MRGGFRSGAIGVLASVALHVLGAVWLPSAHGVSLAGAITEAAQFTSLESTTGAGTTPFSMEILPSAVAPQAVVPSHEKSLRDAPDVDNGGANTGGSGTPNRPTWLLDVSDALTLQESVRNASDESQVQRIRTSDDRSSQENRRAALAPSDATYLATGAGKLDTRTEKSRRDPAPGLRHTDHGRPEPSPGTRELVGDTAAVQAAHGTRSEPARTTERGRADTRGTTHSAAARQQTARPDVDRGPPATLAANFGRVQDNRNAELRAAQLLQAFVQTGSAEGESADGSGGRDTGGDPGSGTHGRPGGRSSVRGTGGQAEPGGERYTRWYVEQRARIARALVFPKERQLSLDQGTTVLRLSVGRDGALLEAPHMLRSSGFDDLDRAAFSAVLAAVPLSPLPPEIAPGRDHLSVTVPVEFWNPTVH